MNEGGYAVAYALSTAAGIRPFVTLAVSAWMMNAGELNPDPHFAWLGHVGVAILLSVLAVVEFIADKIPVVDNFFHAVHFAVKPIAAALISGGTVTFQDASSAQNAAHVLIILASVANVLGIHLVSVTLRGITTSFTFGTVNPVVSLAEDILCIIALLVAIFIPLLGVIVAILTTIFSYLTFIHLFRYLQLLRKKRLAARI